MTKYEGNPLFTPDLTAEQEFVLSKLDIDPADLVHASISLWQIEKITGHRVDNQRILDVGCGSGERNRRNQYVMPPALPLFLAVCGAQAYGIDPGTQDPLHMNHIHRYGGDIIRHTITSLHKALNDGRNPFGNPLDVVITERVIGNNSDPNYRRLDPEDQRLYLADQRSKYLAVCSMVLKPGGVAFFDWRDDRIEDGQKIGKYTYWRKPEVPTQPVNGNLFSSQ